jgi:predicted nucleic acid-binding protein
LFYSLINFSVLVKEVGNAIWKAFIKNYITIDLIEKANEIAIKTKITLYDSLYIALALKEKAKLLTLDDTQAQAAEEYGIEIIKV